MDLPGEIELQDGVYEVGREEPADVVIPVPTVSGRHALLRISKSGCHPSTQVSAIPTDGDRKAVSRTHVPAPECFCLRAMALTCPTCTA